MDALLDRIRRPPNIADRIAQLEEAEASLLARIEQLETLVERMAVKVERELGEIDRTPKRGPKTTTAPLAFRYTRPNPG